MMKKIGSAAAGILILLLLCSGIFADLVRFFAWLFTLQYSQSDTSVAGSIIVRILTFVVSYGLVGLIFKCLDCFNSKAMSIIYFIISTLLGFVLAYVVWVIEKYILVIGIVMGVIFLGVIVYFSVCFTLDRKKMKGESNG
ncbi:MAG: hypothetical protein SPF87_03050 [Bacilli bacterium]|nr:hypothetical protein [Bacilli bacterium]